MTAAAARVGVAGANGRMGRAIVGALHGVEDLRLTGAWERPGSIGVGAPYIADRSVTLAAGPDALAGAIDVVIDFTAASATVQHAAWCAANGVAMVIGTTGLSDADSAAIDAASTQIAIVQAPNVSVCVNTLDALV